MAIILRSVETTSLRMLTGCTLTYRSENSRIKRLPLLLLLVLCHFLFLCPEDLKNNPTRLSQVTFLHSTLPRWSMLGVVR